MTRRLPAWLIRRSRLRKAGVGLLVALGLAALVWWLLPKPDLYPSGFTFSRAMTDRQGRIIHLALTTDAKYRLHTRLADISPELTEATMLLEDQHFRSHP